QKKISKLKYLLTDKVVCVSDFVKQILYANYRLDSDVIYDAVDHGLIHKVDAQKVSEIKKQYGPVIIGNIGALTAQKDHKTLIDAASQLDKSYIFLVLGEGNLRQELEVYAKQKGVNNIVFLGFRDDIQNYLAAFDLFVISSEYEGLCSSILQAFLFKVPVVATNAGGVSELIGDNQRGLLVPIKDSQALAQNIENLIQNKKISKDLSDQAYQFSIHFSLNSITKYKLIYEQIIITIVSIFLLVNFS
ncbi:glycosyltransferase, partial [Desulfurella sp.]|uniref:glycosyltransferase n=1 Tax=Desulfurella sp. TaxID=1962857 RepID=UPI003D109ABB